MDGRIAHLRSHYRLAGSQAAAPAVASRLDRLLREEAIRSCDEALDSALAGDESVYVLRRVKVKTSIVLDADATDAAIGKRWGEHLATAVMRAIARGEDAAGNFVRFENQAEYVASFLVALLQGADHRQWFYSAFDYVALLEKKSAIKRVLLDNVSHAPAILACIHRHEELDSLLATLDTETKQALWSPESEQRDDLEISRSLFTTALQLVQRLEAWPASSKSADELFGKYWQTDPPFADWRDPRSLAEAVLEVVRYFVAHGHISSPEDVGELSIRLGEALEGFEWLDREWLRFSVLELFEKRDPITLDLPVRVPTTRATPRQQELLAAITAAISDANVVHGGSLAAIAAAGEANVVNGDSLAASAASSRDVNVVNGDSPAASAASSRDVNVVNGDSLAAALKILALLVSAAPGWAEDAAAKVMIENLLAAATAVHATPAPAEFLKLLQHRDVEGALRLLPFEHRERFGDACRTVAALGEPALELLEKLKKAEAKQWASAIESECAGVALLVRTMLDARLHAMADEDAFPVTGDWPQLVMLFILVAHSIAGEKAFVDGSLERGLCLLAGLDRAPTLAELQAVWCEAETVDYSNFQKALLQIAAAHRVIDEDQDFATITGEWQTGSEGSTGNPNLDRTTTFLTCLLLKMWAHWLRGFSTSSVTFLVDSFIRRRGRIYAEKDFLLVELEQRPLDVVMEMAGYLADLERVPWLPGKRIKFVLRGS
jgi:hypothetical protein